MNTNERALEDEEARLASASLAAGDLVGWFDRLYAVGAAGRAPVPWSRCQPHPLLAEWGTAASPGREHRTASSVSCRACDGRAEQLTGLFGVGPVIAATVLGEVRDGGRFPDRNHFAAYDGTAPIEVSSGNRKIYRLSRRGNRRLNHAVHMAAVTQIRNPAARGAPTTTRNWPRARSRRKHCAPSNTGPATRSPPA